MVIFLTGLVAIILMRTLRKDYARYAKTDADLESLEHDLSEVWKCGVLRQCGQPRGCRCLGGAPCLHEILLALDVGTAGHLQSLWCWVGQL